ncbi:serine/threonine-protein kinase [Synechococcus sp. PCC 6312]|uniref:serine/threonine-protein kinase n=1 Tax=Synechococcus sp. (strain ATCC 27167 / PCC 6312) TaxID=195253 RepID=UPI00029EE484|nr:serine/threonine-protein kinase [Synechococcus sp. PCC 6312]AFY60921.1 serine/threonine protein kinase [Synechococcus sp. PCC 6312]
MQVHCTRPGCPQPINNFPELDDPAVRKKSPQKFCLACGMPLILRSRYVPQKLLGQGGFGAAYFARDLDTPRLRECVIKQLVVNTTDPETLAKTQELFEREGEVLENLGTHAQIPDLYAYFELDVPNPQTGRSEPYFYIAQEFIDGETLEEEVTRKGRFTEAEVVALLREILPVLQYVHDNGSIHRDIKLSNIMRQHPHKTKVPNQASLYLLDFGAVKQLATLGGPNKMTGIYTLHFAPPEQSRGEQVFPSSDLYALAVTCVVLLTGKPPSDLYEAYTNSWKWRPYAQVTEQLAQVLDRMLLPAPSQRFQSASDAYYALTQGSIIPTPAPMPPRSSTLPITPQPIPPVSAPPPATATNLQGSVGVPSPPIPPASSQNINQPTITPRPAKGKPPNVPKPPKPAKSPAPSLPMVKVLTGAAFTGFEAGILGLVGYGLLTQGWASLGLVAGGGGVVLALLIFLQFKGVIEKWEQLVIAGLSAAVAWFMPFLPLVGVQALLVSGMIAVGLVVIAQIFLLIYTVLSKIL